MIKSFYLIVYDNKIDGFAEFDFCLLLEKYKEEIEIAFEDVMPMDKKEISLE